MWLMPSRRRPANLARFFDAYRATAGSTSGMVIVDRRDWEDERPAYEAIGLPLGWIFWPSKSETQGEKIREVWPSIKDCAWLGLIGDDCVPETKGWDRALLAHFDHALVVSCDDGWQAPKRLGNCWIMAGDLVRELDYVFPPSMQHLFVDDVWEAIGTEARCWHCDMAIRVAHRHVLKGAAPVDETHQVVYGEGFTAPGRGPDRSQGCWESDEKAFALWRAQLKAPAIAAASRLMTARDPRLDRLRLEVEAEMVAARHARLKTRKVMICTPAHRDMVWQYVHAALSTVTLFERSGVPVQVQFVIGSSNLPKARNELCAWFLASDCTDLLFIDSDMGWDPQGALRLIASDKEVVAAVGRRKSEPEVKWCLRLLPGSDHALTQDPMGAVEVLSVGTGMMKIAREAFERIIAERPDLKRSGDGETDEEIRPHLWRFFRFGDEDGGEDYEFCALWRSIGGSVWIDPTISMTHVGDKEYRGRFADILVAAHATAEAA